MKLTHRLCWFNDEQVMKDIEFLQNLGKPLQREELDLAYVLPA